MNARKPWRLSAMMALVYAVQGSFWPLLAVHLADLGIGGPRPRLDLRDAGDRARRRCRWGPGSSSTG